MPMTAEQAFQSGLISQAELDRALVMEARGAEIDALRAAWELWYRREILRLSAVLCGCRQTFTWFSGEAPQASCPLHSHLIVTPDGEVL